MQSKTSEDRMNLLIRLIDEIITKSCADETDSIPAKELVRQYWNQFCTIYEDAEFRHSYSKISVCLEGYDPEQRDSLPVYLNQVVSYAESQEDAEATHGVMKSVKKLLDHVELECIRLNRMRQVEYLANDAKRIQTAAILLNQETKETEERLDKRVTGFHEQSITILGIFSAVVVGFMSGISMFISGFNKLNEVSVYVVTFYSVAVGIILFDVLFMLIFFIAKMSGHSIARKTKAAGNWFVTTWHRYPYIYCFHIFAILVLIVLAVLQETMGVVSYEAVARSMIG